MPDCAQISGRNGPSCPIVRSPTFCRAQTNDFFKLFELAKRVFEAAPGVTLQGTTSPPLAPVSKERIFDMAQENDPTQRFLTVTQNYQAKLTYLWKTIFKKVTSILGTATSFLGKVIAEAAKFQMVVGKTVVKKVVEVGQWVIDLTAQIPVALKAAIKFGRRIITLITKATDPNKIIGTLKKLFSRYISMLQEIFGSIQQLTSQLDVIGTVLSLVGTFKAALQAMFSWISEVTRATDAVVKAKRLLKKVMKELKQDIKETVKLRKEVMKLKKAA